MARPETSPRIALIGVPYDSGGTAEGTAKAPSVLRRHGLVSKLRTVADVADYGDLNIAPSGTARDPSSGLVGERTFLAMLDDVRGVVTQAFAEKRFPVLVGGDCPILLGGLASIKAGGRVPGLLFVDGHEDAYGPHESPTGETADMEFGLAIGDRTDALPSELAKHFPVVRARDAVILGARDAEVIRHDGARSIQGTVELYTGAALAAAPTATVRAALAKMSGDVSLVWLHTDLDVLSTEALAAVDYHLPGGLSWAELTEVVGEALSKRQVVGWDITIYNPDLNPGERSADRIVDYIVAGVGSCAKVVA
ncbi:MAG: arginase family protein [Acidimicrobiales bacterium]